MKLRLIETITNNEQGRVAKVYRDAEWQEYRVRYFENGQHLTEADYHCDDKSEAQSNARRFTWLSHKVAA